MDRHLHFKRICMVCRAKPEKGRGSGKAAPRGKSLLRRQLDAMETDDDADEDDGDISADDMDVDARGLTSSRATPAYSEEGLYLLPCLRVGQAAGGERWCTAEQGMQAMARQKALHGGARTNAEARG